MFPPLARAETALRRRRLAARAWDIAFIADMTPSDLTAVDVGANIGIYTSILTKKFGTTIACEPSPVVWERLRAHRGPRAIVLPVAVSDACGMARLSAPVRSGRPVAGLGQIVPELGGTSGAVGPTRDWLVPIVTLDSVVSQLHHETRLGLVKIDVEGHEERVLAGAADCLARDRPDLLIEIEERLNPGGVGRIAGALAELGYHGLFVHRDRSFDVGDFDPAVVQVDATDPRTYSNMFWFTTDPRRHAEIVAHLDRRAHAAVCDEQ